MVIDYDTVILSFQNHGNQLQHVLSDYKSEKVFNQLHSHVICDASVLCLNIVVV